MSKQDKATMRTGSLNYWGLGTTVQQAIGKAKALGFFSALEPNPQSSTSPGASLFPAVALHPAVCTSHRHVPIADNSQEPESKRTCEKWVNYTSTHFQDPRQMH